MAPANLHFIAQVSTSSIRHQENKKQHSQSVSIGNRISEYLVGIIKNESKALADALVSESPDYFPKDDIEDSIFRSEFSKLNSRVKMDLEGKIDNYNKLSALLTYDPILVHPSIYLGLYGRLEQNLDRDLETTLLRRLIYHRRFEACWKILLDGFTTMNDIDDQLDFFSKELEMCNNLEFGVCDLLIAAHSVIANNNILMTLIESISFKFKMDPNLPQMLFEYYQKLQSIDSLDRLTQFHDSLEPKLKKSLYINGLYFRNYTRLLCLLSGDEQSRKAVKRFHKDLFEANELTNVPGWLSFILKDPQGSDLFTLTDMDYKDTDVSKEGTQIDLIPFTMLKHKRIKINQYEFSFCMKALSTSKVYDCHDIYKRVLKRYKSNPNTYVANQLVTTALESEDKRRLSSIARDLYHFIDDDLITSVLLKIYPYSKKQFHSFLKRIDRDKRLNRMQIYKTFIEKSLKEGNTKVSIVSIMELLNAFYKSNLSSFVLLTTLSHMRKINYNKSDRYQFFKTLVSERNYSTYALLEIFRCIIREDDSKFNDIHCEVFQNLIKKSLSKEKLLTRIPHLEWNREKDFEVLFKYATHLERSRFHNRMRALAQCISQIPVDEITRIFNLYHALFNSDEFEYISSRTGKVYILDSLLIDLIRFLERTSIDSPRECLSKVRRLAQNLSFKSEVIQGSMYRLMVKQDSNKALEFIRFHNDNNSKLTKSSIRYITLGIFHNTNISPSKRFSTFKALNEELGKNYYDITYDKHTIIEMIKVLVLIYESDPHNSPVSATWIINYAFSKKVPRKIILHWIKRLKPSTININS